MNGESNTRGITDKELKIILAFNAWFDKEYPQAFLPEIELDRLLWDTKRAFALEGWKVGIKHADALAREEEPKP